MEAMLEKGQRPKHHPMRDVAQDTRLKKAPPTVHRTNQTHVEKNTNEALCPHLVRITSLLHRFIASECGTFEDKDGFRHYCVMRIQVRPRPSIEYRYRSTCLYMCMGLYEHRFMVGRGSSREKNKTTRRRRRRPRIKKSRR